MTRVPAPSRTGPAAGAGSGGHRRRPSRVPGRARLLAPLRALTLPTPAHLRSPVWRTADLFRLRERAVRLATILAALAVLGTGTAAGTAIVERSTGTTMTQRRAVDRTEEHLRRTTAGVGLPMRLEPQSRQTTPCAATSGRNRRERVEYRYAVRDVGIPNPDVFGAFRRYWLGHGYQVTKDDVTGTGVLSAESGTDGYLLTLGQNPQGELTLVVTSPCIVEERR